MHSPTDDKATAKPAKKTRNHERKPVPPARVAVKPPPPGAPTAEGWVVHPVNLTALPHVRFLARAYYPGKEKPVQRFFRDHASAKSWADEQNAALAKFDPKRLEELLTSKQVCDLLKLSEDGLWHQRKKGMPFIKISPGNYRYRWSEITEYLNAGREVGAVENKPFVVEQYNERSRPDLKFRVRGTGEWKDEVRKFRTEAEANRYAAARNRAVGLRANAPIPRHARGADPDGPFCRVSPFQCDTTPWLKYRAYVYFEGQKHCKEWRFETEDEALHFANRKNLEFERERVAREAEKQPAAEVVEREKVGIVPPVQWTEEQIAGFDSGHHYDPVKGPPFRIHATTQSGYKFVVRGPRTPDGKEPRTFFKTEREAKAFAHLRNTEAQQQGLESVIFPSALRVMAQKCQAQLGAYGKTIEDAASYYLAYLKRTAESVTLESAVTQLLESRKGTGVTKFYVTRLKKRCERFRDIMGPKRIISEITTEEISEYLRAIEGAPATKNCDRSTLWTLFTFAEKAGLRTGNPVAATTRFKDIDAPVGIFTVEQVTAMLATIPDYAVPYFAIGAFAGLRTAELQRLDWSEVDLQDGFIEVTAKNAKSARRRLVKILPVLAAFLRPYEQKGGRVWPRGRCSPCRVFTEAMRKSDIREWPKNALRHSFASYHIAHFRDAAGLALEMGHTTTQLIFQHYRQVVKQADAARYWEIKPARQEEPGKVVQFAVA